jgi:hypothetical protein
MGDYYINNMNLFRFNFEDEKSDQKNGVKDSADLDQVVIGPVELHLLPGQYRRQFSAANVEHVRVFAG